jgi:hypothetical protein
MDGSAHAWRRNLDAKTFRALIVMNDGTVTPPLKNFRAAMPADSPDEKLRLKKQIDENQEVIDQIERLMKEYRDLLALQNKLIGDLSDSEDQHEYLRQMVNQLKLRNKKIRDDIGLKDGAPVPK